MKSKGQVEGQIIVFILAIVIFSLIIVYGYNAITGFRDRADQVLFIEFKTDLTSTVDKIADDYGSERKERFSLLSEITRVCFIGKDDVSFAGNEIIQDAVESGSEDNIFLLKNSRLYDSFEVGPLEIDDQLTDQCLPVVDGVVKIKFIGLGDAAEISTY